MLWNSMFTLLSIAGFLGGLHLMRAGLEGTAAGRLPVLLKYFVKTPSRGIVTGAVVTALVQSSAAVTAITVGMVAGGTMIFRDALGIVLGSNVGTTITPQLLRLNLWFLVGPCLLIGSIGLVSRKNQWRHPSMGFVGFATIFIALQTLSIALHPITVTKWFASSLNQAGQHVWMAMLVGCVASAAVQSSTATTVITMALASQGSIPTSGAIAIVLGANVGTCFTSVVAAIGQTRAAQQVALSHVILNVAGVFLFMPLLKPYTAWMATLSPSISQQIANAHTIFNIVCTLVVWPFTNRFATFIQKILPDHVKT